MIQTKSTQDPPSKEDGLRLFVTRYWPRGHGREECDEWLPSLAPSEVLLRRFQAAEIPWKEFERQYKQEMLKGYADEAGVNPRMRNSGQKYVVRLLKMIAREQAVTLICTCPPEAEFCHRHILKRLIEE